MIDRVDLKIHAKQMISGNMGMLIVCLVIVTALSSISCTIPIVGGVLTACVAGPLALGNAYVYLNLAVRIAPNLNILFLGFQRFVDSLVLWLLISVFTFLWSLLFVVPGIIKWISYSQAFYVLAEHPEMSGKEALDESIVIMDGHKMDYFVLMLSFIPWMLLGSITCGIALLYVIPYMNATLVNFYEAIRLPVKSNWNTY